LQEYQKLVHPCRFRSFLAHLVPFPTHPQRRFPSFWQTFSLPVAPLLQSRASPLLAQSQFFEDFRIFSDAEEDNSV
jgi:hypothetical protein